MFWMRFVSFRTAFTVHFNILGHLNDGNRADKGLPKISNDMLSTGLMTRFNETEKIMMFDIFEMSQREQ